MEPPRDAAHSLAIASVAFAVAPLPLLVFTVLPIVGLLAAPLALLAVLAALGLAIASCVQAVRSRASLTVPLVAVGLSLLWPIVLAAALVLFRRSMVDFD